MKLNLVGHILTNLLLTFALVKLFRNIRPASNNTNVIWLLTKNDFLYHTHAYDHCYKTYSKFVYMLIWVIFRFYLHSGMGDIENHQVSILLIQYVRYGQPI